MDDCEWTENDDAAFNLRLVQEYKAAKEMADTSKKRADGLKSQLIELVDERGYEGENGHRWFEVGDHKLKRERRVSTIFDSEACEAWAKEQGKEMWDKVSEVVEVLVEDKVLGLAWDHPDMRDIVNGFYIERETWAFKA